MDRTRHGGEEARSQTLQNDRGFVALGGGIGGNVPFPGLFCLGGDIPGGASLPGIFFARLHRISSISGGSQEGSLQNQVCLLAVMRCGSRAGGASHPAGGAK